MTPLDALNTASAAEFGAALEGVFERAPWVAERTAPLRPFATMAELHAALMQVLRAAGRARLLDFLNAHEPLVAGPLPETLTAASRQEQGDAPLGALVTPQALTARNAAYRQRFGFPFILCLRRHSAANVLRQLDRRLTAEPAAEFATALEEIGHVSRFRLLARVTGPGAPDLAGRIAVRAATPVEVSLEREGAAVAWAALPAGAAVTLLEETPLRLGHYTLRDEAGAVLREFWPEVAEAQHLLEISPAPA